MYNIYCIVPSALRLHCQALIQKIAWKVADGVATHSKSYWCKVGGWLITVNISYTTLHKRIDEGGWLATLSTPLDQPLTTMHCHWYIAKYSTLVKECPLWNVSPPPTLGSISC